MYIHVCYCAYMCIQNVAEELGGSSRSFVQPIRSDSSDIVTVIRQAYEVKFAYVIYLVSVSKYMWMRLNSQLLCFRFSCMRMQALDPSLHTVIMCVTFDLHTQVIGGKVACQKEKSGNLQCI